MYLLPAGSMKCSPHKISGFCLQSSFFVLNSVNYVNYAAKFALFDTSLFLKKKVLYKLTQTGK